MGSGTDGSIVFVSCACMCACAAIKKGLRHVHRERVPREVSVRDVCGFSVRARTVNDATPRGELVCMDSLRKMVCLRHASCANW